MENSQDRKDRVYSEFCAVNRRFWKKNNSVPKTKTVLVEGFFGESGPNYVIRIGSIAKIAEEVLDCKSVVLLERGEKQEPDRVKIWRSFYLDEFIGIFDEIYRNFSSFQIAVINGFASFYFRLSQVLFFLKKPEWFLKLSVGGVRIGDLLYDEIIKENEYLPKDAKKNYTIKRLTSYHKKFFDRTFIYFFASRFVYKKYRPLYYITTHTQYIPYGLPSRYFAACGAKVIESTDDLLFTHDDPKFYPPKFHKEVGRMVGKVLHLSGSEEEKNNRLLIAVTELEKRFAGKTNQIDVQMAYTQKQKYSDEALRKVLGISNLNPFVFVFAHIFSDSPQAASDGMLFVDYYTWLSETLRYVKKIKNINWIIKAHPASRTYGELGEVERMVRDLCGSESTVFFCPDNFNTSSTLECAKAVITVQGTAGLEFSCMGIPVILAGKPFFSGFGFTREPSTKSGYFREIEKIYEIEPLCSDQIERARLVYAAFFEIQAKDFSLIDTELKDKTWGCGVEQDIIGAFAMMSKRLQIKDPRTTHLSQQVREYFEKEVN